MQCVDKTFYCGWTLDVEDRVRVHNEGKGAKYCAKRLPVKLIYVEDADSVGAVYGQIAGAYYGIETTVKVDLIIDMANKLYEKRKL